MKSKKELMEIIEKESGDRSQYLWELFKYIPEDVVLEMIYTESKKNDYILIAGEACESVYIILKGNVIGVEHHKMGRIYSFMDFSKMYIIGDFELYADCREYNVSIQAAEDCKLLKLSAGSYMRWVQNDQNALLLRLKMTVKTLTSERKIDRENLLMGSKERLVSFLLRLYEKKHTVGKVRVDITQAELADKIGVNTRSVQRSIVSLETADRLSVINGKIVISYEQYMKLKQDDEKMIEKAH